MKSNNTKNKQYYFFNTVDLPYRTEQDEYKKKHIVITTKTGITLFDSDDYKDEGLIIEIE